MTRAEGAGERIMVEFRDRDGAPIPDLAVTARFEHPFDAALDRAGDARFRRPRLRGGRDAGRAGPLDSW